MNEARTSSYGVLARFDDAEALLAAAHSCRREYSRVEAYTPCAVAGLEQALGLEHDRTPRFALGGALFGALSGFLIQTYTAVVDYPIDVGGRPDFSWPAFLPITVILALFWGAAGAVLGFLVKARLPRLHHPLFAAPGFEDASRNGFFLVVRGGSPDFAVEDAIRFLRSLGATQACEVME